MEEKAMLGKLVRIQSKPKDVKMFSLEYRVMGVFVTRSSVLVVQFGRLIFIIAELILLTNKPHATLFTKMRCQSSSQG